MQEQQSIQGGAVAAPQQGADPKPQDPNGPEDHLFTGTAGSSTPHLEAQERFQKPAALKRISWLKASATTEGKTTSYLNWLFLTLCCSWDVDKDQGAPTAGLPWEDKKKLSFSCRLPASLFVPSFLDLQGYANSISPIPCTDFH